MLVSNRHLVPRMLECRLPNEKNRLRNFDVSQKPEIYCTQQQSAEVLQFNSEPNYGPVDAGRLAK